MQCEREVLGRPRSEREAWPVDLYTIGIGTHFSAYDFWEVSALPLPVDQQEVSFAKRAETADYRGLRILDCVFASEAWGDHDQHDRE
jgi:hypothetical protein